MATSRSLFMFKDIYLLWLGLTFLLHVTTAKSVQGFSQQTYKQPCNNDDDCVDFRLICHERYRICSCTSFYDWNNETKECHLNTNKLTLWLSDQSNRNDNEGIMEKDLHLLFSIQSIAGLFAIVTLCIVCLIICSLAFCVFKEKDDEQPIAINEERNIETPSSTRG